MAAIGNVTCLVGWQIGDGFDPRFQTENQAVWQETEDGSALVKAVRAAEVARPLPALSIQGPGARL